MIGSTEKYGPQTAEVEALLARTAGMSPNEVEALSVAWHEVRGTDTDAAWKSAWAVVQYPRDPRSEAWRAAQITESDAAWDAAWRVVRDSVPHRGAWYAMCATVRATARDAMLALIVRDLIGQHGFTQENYDVLTKAWAVTIGKVHPDD